MKAITKKSLLALLAVPAFVLGLAFVGPSVGALGVGDGASSAQPTDQAAAPICIFRDGNGDPCSTDIFKTITDILLFLIGAVSVIMLIIGGIRYTLSGGDSAAVTSAKNTILYAIVGIVVAILAYAVVSFVVGSF